MPQPRTTLPPFRSDYSEVKKCDFDTVLAKPALEKSFSVSDAVATLLADLGVQHAFGLVGGAVAPLCEALARSPIRVIHCRHESGAAFAATEASLTTGRPTAVFTTTGPGLMNALTGMSAARWDGARVILLSGSTSPRQRGRWAFQETSAYTTPVAGLFTAGPLFHFAVSLEDPIELLEVGRRLAMGLARPSGFVAHLSVPIALQTVPVPALPRFSVPSIVPSGGSPEIAARCAQLLSEGPFVLWLGFGARGASDLVRTFVERTGVPVICSPRAKGIFPEDHPQFVGVTGLGGHASVKALMAHYRPLRTLVLGSRLGEFTSFWDPELVPPRGFIHVDIDPEVPGAAYPSAHTFAVQAEISSFLKALLEHLPERMSRRSGEWPVHLPPSRLEPRATGSVRPLFLMQAIQRVVVDGSDAVILTEAGNAFAWGNHALRFRSSGRYRVSTGYGSMGHAVTGVVGTALARHGKAIAIVGDGAMLMNSEISTAVRYDIPAVWIVLNDARYGMIEQGMRAQGFEPVETAIPPTDFVLIARGMGADGLRVERETDVEPALHAAMQARVPFVVDVAIDPNEPGPFLQRVQSLIQQGAQGRGGPSQ